MEICCFLIHGQNNSDNFLQSDEKRTSSLQSSNCWTWDNWLPSKMQFHQHTKTLLSAILLSLHYCSGHIFECHRHIDEIPACISKLFFQGFQCIEKTTMVQKQFFVGHPLKSQQIPIFSHCSVHWRICHSSNFWTIPVWNHQNNRCFIAVSTKYCDQLSQRQLTSLIV